MMMPTLCPRCSARGLPSRDGASAAAKPRHGTPVHARHGVTLRAS